MSGEAHADVEAASRDDERFVPDAAIAEAELAFVPSETPAPSLGWRRRLAPYLVVSAGGALGANLRYLVGLWTAAR